MRPIQITKIKKSDAFIAFITERFIEQKEEKYRECKMAEKLNKPMYAIVDKREMVWRPFEDLPWRKIYYCEDGVESIMKDIEDDLAWFRSIQR